MKIQLHYHAILREKLGQASEVWELDGGCNSQDLLNEFLRRHPTFDGLADCLRIACNHEFIDWDEPLHEGDRVDLLPPFGGG